MTSDDLPISHQKPLTNLKVASLSLLWFAIWLLLIGSFAYLRINELKTTLSQQGKSYASRLNTHLASSDAILEGFSALFKTIGEINPETVRRYVEIVTENNPIIFSLEIALKIPEEELKHLNRNMSSAYPDFYVKSFSYDSVRKWEPIKKKSFYVPLIFIAPLHEGTDEVIGLDLDSIPFIKNALDKSIDTGMKVATQPFNLVEGNRAFIVLSPIRNYPSLKVKVGAFDFQSDLITDIVIDTTQLSKELRVNLDHGESIILFHSDFQPDDAKGNLFKIADDKISLYEAYLFPEFVYEESLLPFNKKFTVQLRHQIGIADMNISFFSILLFSAIVTSCMLVAYLQLLRKKTLLQIENELHLWSLANHDFLTDLANRNLLMNRMDQLVSKGRRHDEKFAIIYLDLDGFKQINDTHGHTYGDKLLKNVAKSLLQVVRKEDTVSRVGGDEFIILIENLESKESLDSVCLKIHQELRNCAEIEGTLLNFRASIGTAIFPDEAQSIDSLIKIADSKMYNDKRLNGQSFHALRETGV